MAVKKLAILGCGYVGSALAMRAQSKGWAVHALTRNIERAEHLSKHGVSVVRARTDEAGWEADMPSTVDAVVYCASSASRDLDGYRKSYIEGQNRALSWAQAVGANHYIYTSSSSVYGEAKGAWVDESSGPWSETPFAQILLDAEQRVSEASIKTTVLRFAGIYGPQRHLLWDRVAANTGEPLPGYGDIYLNLVHRDDCAGAIIHCLDAAVEGSRIYNVADNSPATRQEIVDWCAGQLGKPAPTFSPSEAMADSRARRYAEGRRPSRRVSTAFIQSDLGWKPVYSDFRAGYLSLGLKGSL